MGAETSCCHAGTTVRVWGMTWVRLPGDILLTSLASAYRTNANLASNLAASCRIASALPLFTSRPNIEHHGVCLRSRCHHVRVVTSEQFDVALQSLHHVTSGWCYLHWTPDTDLFTDVLLVIRRVLILGAWMYDNNLPIVMICRVDEEEGLYPAVPPEKVIHELVMHPSLPLNPVYK
ncbi:hypothetical protein BDN71DRAFT_607150 [Pleurotus eryngii]|uniref:Uncharacterized protein n=1 Tax=Pleurotus eryngii TaxID=5323 RepID=A0A9P6A150_PLEER|nr:hypothetical protein BDN71DRAFT_607150 [Pleurotus eryngii]